MKIDYQNELNSEQYKVVTDGDGPCLVLAGAGSGKTRTLVYRLAYLLEKGIDPSNILLVTFTNKAAKEMVTRVQTLLGFTPEGLNAGTFHHMGNKLLRKYGDRLKYNRSFSILDQDDSVDLIKSAMQDLNINIKGQNFPKPSVVQSVISFARNANQPISDIAQNNYGFPDFISEMVEKVYDSYQEKKFRANAMDFDDLLVNWLKLLRTDKEIKEKLSKQFQYILVDEYQDTNYIQAAIITEMSTYHNNVLVVGDDSQSIYSFRAADVNNILGFPQEFKNAKIYRIETNYRSTPEILELANNSIRHNQDKYDKALKAKRSEGYLPSLIPARDVYQQASLIANKIIEFVDKGATYNNIAILFRAVFHSAELQLELARRNIPFVVRGGLRYFDQAHIKDMISYLKIVHNFQDELAWKRIMRMYDGVGPASAEKIWKEISKHKNLTELLSSPIKITGSRAQNSWSKISSIFYNLNKIDYTKRGSLAEAVIYIMDNGYRDYLKNTFENFKDRLDDLQQFIDFVMTYKNLESLLSDVMLSEQFSRDEETKDNSVVLSTIHQSKGLEWRYVMIISLRDGDFPHYKCLEDPKQLEEERRLFYVAATRAKDDLYMFYPVRKNTFQYGEMVSGPSMFIKEVDETLYTTTRSNQFLNQDDDGETVIYYD